MLGREGVSTEAIMPSATTKAVPPVRSSPLTVCDRLLSLARAAADAGRRDAALLLLAAAQLALERPLRRRRRAGFAGA